MKKCISCGLSTLAPLNSCPFCGGKWSWSGLAPNPPHDPTPLIDAHWEYVGAMLATHGIEPEILGVIEFHYKSAGRHFWKHCEEHYGVGK